MAVLSRNTNATPMTFGGSAIQVGSYANGPYLSAYYGGGYATQASPLHRVDSITTVNQVVGFVPLYPCTATECRLGKYGSSDADFMLPVFAQNQPSVWGDYKNDNNSWLFNFPASSALAQCNFYLDKKINGAWVEQGELDDDTYGFYYPVGKICDKNYWTGYNLLWNKVLYTLGEGVYRFRIGRSTGSFKQSENHFKILGFKPGTIPTIELKSVGFGLICPTFTVDTTLTAVQNMQNLVIWINNYQAATYATPQFSAAYNSVTLQIDLFGLLGQNCACSALVTDVTYSNYAQAFSTGINTYQVIACFATPPFCLKEWDCYAVDRTTKFEAFYAGGVIGNIDKSLPGTTWSFCCSGNPVSYPSQKSRFDIRYWAESVINTAFTQTFSVDLGYDLLPSITYAPGSTYITMAQQLAAAINTYQAGLTPPQFSAYYNPVNQRCEITHIFGLNLTVTMTSLNAKCDNNSVQWTFFNLITYPPTGTCDVITIGTFVGGSNLTATNSLTTPISWRDSIRVGGEFGYENTEYERKSIKYQTGLVNNARSEALLKFTWKSSSLPFWFHERFKQYGLLADRLLASDYNLNNADYNLKQYSVHGDSGYSPEYKGYTRNTIVKCDFKPEVQNLKRSKCC